MGEIGPNAPDPAPHWGELGPLDALCSLRLPDRPPGCPSSQFISPFKIMLYN